MSPVEAIFVPFPPKTGTNLLHPLPPPIVERVSSASFPCYHARLKRLKEFSAEDESDRDTQTIWMRSSFQAGHGSSRSLIQKGTIVS